MRIYHLYRQVEEVENQMTHQEVLYLDHMIYQIICGLICLIKEIKS